MELFDRIAKYRRMHGYYLLHFRDITPLRDAGLSDEEICDVVFPAFDDDRPWPPREVWLQGHTWEDCRVESDVAREEMIRGLIGGNEVGHTVDTIPREIAAGFVDEFEALFAEPRHYYSGLGFGKREYVYSTGCAIVTATAAGCLIVVESD